jgi:cytochrome c oxidase subunit III
MDESRKPDERARADLRELEGWGDGDDDRPRGPTVAPPDATTLGVKLFLASLVMLFGATLIGYVVTRVQAEKWDSLRAEELHGSLIASTVLIVLVSAALHFAVEGIRHDRRDRLKFGLFVATILAVLFLVNQNDVWSTMFERLKDQSQQVRVGQAEGGDLSVFLFFAMTFLHALHVLGGFIPLGVVIVGALRNKYSGATFRGVWNCALYWHFIDGVWILIAIALAVG